MVINIVLKFGKAIYDFFVALNIPLTYYPLGFG